MNVYLLLDVNIFSAFILLAVSLSIFVQRNRYAFSTSIFWAMLCSTFILLLLDCFLLTQGRDLLLMRIVSYVYILLSPLPACLWISYFDFQLNDSSERIYKRMFYLFPLIIPVICAIIFDLFLKRNLFVLYNDDIGFRFGVGIWIVGAVSYFLILFSFLLAWRHKGHLEKRLRWTMILLSIIPAIGAIIQTFNHFLPVKWPLVTLSISLAYLFVEIQHEGRDYLTGLYNRKQLDDFLHYRMRSYMKKGSFSLIVIDLDNFKTINDTYGHKEGDRALVDFSRLISRSVKQNDMVSRFGGDEFILLMDSGDSTVIDKVLKRIENRTLEENMRRDTGYHIHFSAGYAVYSPGEYPSARELFHEADMRMFQDKEKNRDIRIDA